MITIESEWKKFFDRQLKGIEGKKNIKAAKRIYYAGFIAGITKDPTLEEFKAISEEARDFMDLIIQGKA